jgi:cathepsin L
MKARLDISPMTVALSAGNTVFQYYTGGIISSIGCNITNGVTNKVDHAIGVIGYGSDATTGFDYWVFRNQWGVSWGERGYVRVAIDYSGSTGPTLGRGYCHSHTEMYRAIVQPVTYY